MKPAKNLVEYKMPDYAPCSDEHASNKPEAAPRAPASVPEVTETVAAPAAEKPANKNIGVDYDNSAVQFSF